MEILMSLLPFSWSLRVHLWRLRWHKGRIAARVEQRKLERRDATTLEEVHFKVCDTIDQLEMARAGLLFYREQLKANLAFYRAQIAKWDRERASQES